MAPDIGLKLYENHLSGSGGSGGSGGFKGGFDDGLSGGMMVMMISVQV